MQKKTFILGVGAQKSGTSWLHKYLVSNKNVNMGPVKEYHVWDAAYHDLWKGNLQKLQDNTAFSKLRTALRGWQGKPDNYRIRAQFREDHERYFDFFEILLQRKGITLTGDITPAYSALSPELLWQIKSGFAARNIHVRVVFLMRDPVDRVWSALRMYQRRVIGGEIDLLQEENASLRSYYSSKPAKLRGNYHDTIKNLEKVFAKDDIHFGVFENMFEASELARLSAFLRLPVLQRLAGRKVNSGGSKPALCPDLAQEIRANYADVYDYCAQKFPETKALWRDIAPKTTS